MKKRLEHITQTVAIGGAFEPKYELCDGAGLWVCSDCETLIFNALHYYFQQ